MTKDIVPQVQIFEAQTQIFKVLTHPTRIAILEILRDGEQCVCHMETHLGLRQAYISQQLAVLREAGIIRDQRDGWNIFYSVVDLRIFDVLDIVHKIVGVNNLDVKFSDVHCSCPRCVAGQ